MTHQSDNLRSRFFLFRWLRFFVPETLARKMLVSILFVSGLITVVATAVQLALDYQADISAIETRMELVEQGFTESIISSLWSMDYMQLNVQLTGILRLPDMRIVEIYQKSKILFAEGKPIQKGQPILERRFALSKFHKGKAVELGELRVIADLEQVRKRIFDRLFVIMGTQAVKSILVSLFILMIFQKMITKHIVRIAQYTEQLERDNLDRPLVLERHRFHSSHKDEITCLVNSLNDMRNNLNLSYLLLEEYQHKLEYRVKERTAELMDSNQKLQQEIIQREEVEERLRNSLNEKETLLKEINHRVKNNLQIVSSLLRLQSRNARQSNASEVFRTSQNRIQAMALVHKGLYESESLSEIDFRAYLKMLVSHLFLTYGIQQDKITYHIRGDAVVFGLGTAIPLGLTAQELISNVCKHAFPDYRSGFLDISVEVIDNKQVTIRIADNGVGPPKNFDYRNTKGSLGVQLAINLIEGQLRGSFRMVKNPLESSGMLSVFSVQTEDMRLIEKEITKSD
ncbi:sensor histidine kinase [Magnetococcales bacterium HHB-1]